jgi:hypothetical protein
MRSAARLGIGHYSLFVGDGFEWQLPRQHGHLGHLKYAIAEYLVETKQEQSPRILHGSKRHLHASFRSELPDTAEKVP